MKFSEMFQAFRFEERIELQFCLVLVFLAGLVVGVGQISLSVVPDDLEQILVGAGDALVFDVKDRVDDVFAHQRAKAVLQPVAGEEGRLVGRGLPIEVKLRRPPGANAVFKFKGHGPETVASLRVGQGALGLDFEISGLLQVLGVGHEVGFLLRPRNGRLQQQDRLMRGRMGFLFSLK